MSDLFSQQTKTQVDMTYIVQNVLFQENLAINQPERETDESEAIKAIEDATKDILDDSDNETDDSEHSASDSESQPEGDGPLQDLILSLEASKSQLRPPSERGSVKAENFWQDKSQAEAEDCPEVISPAPAEVWACYFTSHYFGLYKFMFA